MKNLKEIREERGLLQKWAAKQLGLKQDTFCNKERGHRKFTAIEVQKLCKLYGVQIEEVKLD